MSTRHPGEGRDPVRDERHRALALTALFVGAVAIGASPLFVKVSETGPVATAFWRVALALPFLWTWAIIGQRGDHAASFARDRRLMIVCGLFFAADLAFWHWSIVLTTVANATLLSNLAPIFITLAVWIYYGRRPGGLFVTGLAAALAGTGALIGGDFRHSGTALAGDCLGVVTAMFYAGYQLTVSRLRSRVAIDVMAWTALISTVTLLPVALLSGEQIVPVSASGWAVLFGLALVSQVAGQSLIAYAMAHLPPTFSSVGLLLQPLTAAALAWVLLGETLDAVQIAGAIVVLIGIWLAHAAEVPREAKA